MAWPNSRRRQSSRSRASCASEEVTSLIETKQSRLAQTSGQKLQMFALMLGAFLAAWAASQATAINSSSSSGGSDEEGEFNSNSKHSNESSNAPQANNDTTPPLDLNALEAARLGYFRHSVPISVILTIAYTIVFVIGIVGNSFVIAIVCKSPRMRTVTNYFIANLALADILVLLLCLPATLVGNLFVPYVLGQSVCKFVSYLQGVSVSASINTMVTVTMDRFLAICFPMDWHMSRRTARWVIACIWLFSLLISLPWALYFTLLPFDYEGVKIQVCNEQWPSEQLGTMYFLCANLLLQYLFPAMVIIFCYLGIWYKIERRNIPGDRVKGQKIELIMQKSKLKVVKMMMVVVIIFLLSWLPLYLIFARIKLFAALESGPWEEWLVPKVMPLAQWLGASNSCINPILYTFFNRKYKRGFLDLLKFAFCCKPLMKSSLTGSTGGGPTRCYNNYANNSSAANNHNNRHNRRRNTTITTTTNTSTTTMRLNGLSMASLNTTPTNTSAAGNRHPISASNSIATSTALVCSASIDQRSASTNTTVTSRHLSSLWTRDNTLVEQSSNESGGTHHHHHHHQQQLKPRHSATPDARRPCNCSSSRHRKRAASTNQRPARRSQSGRCAMPPLACNANPLHNSISSPSSIATTLRGAKSTTSHRRETRALEAIDGASGAPDNQHQAAAPAARLSSESSRRGGGNAQVARDANNNRLVQALSQDETTRFESGDDGGRCLPLPPGDVDVHEQQRQQQRREQSDLSQNCSPRGSIEGSRYTICKRLLGMSASGLCLAHNYERGANEGDDDGEQVAAGGSGYVETVDSNLDYDGARELNSKSDLANCQRQQRRRSVPSADLKSQSDDDAAAAEAEQMGLIHCATPLPADDPQRALGTSSPAGRRKSVANHSSGGGGGTGSANGRSLKSNTSSNTTYGQNTNSTDITALSFTTRRTASLQQMLDSSGEQTERDLEASRRKLSRDETQISTTQGIAACDRLTSSTNSDVADDDEQSIDDYDDDDDDDDDEQHDEHCSRFRPIEQQEFVSSELEEDEEDDEDDDMLFGSADNSPVRHQKQRADGEAAAAAAAADKAVTLQTDGDSRRSSRGGGVGGVGEASGYQVAIKSLATSGTNLANLAMQKLSSSCKFRPPQIRLTARARRRTTSGSAGTNNGGGGGDVSLVVAGGNDWRRPATRTKTKTTAKGGKASKTSIITTRRDNGGPTTQCCPDQDNSGAARR